MAPEHLAQRTLPVDGRAESALLEAVGEIPREGCEAVGDWLKYNLVEASSGGKKPFGMPGERTAEDHAEDSGTRGGVHVQDH